MPDRRLATALTILGIALLICLPFLTTPSPQLGDLHTHLYNAWLTNLLNSTEPGSLLKDCFFLVTPWTNTFLDRLLSFSLRFLLPHDAARLAAILTVSLFFWSTIVWQRQALGRWAIVSGPLILALAHGWLLQAGFLNFLLGLSAAFAFSASLSLTLIPRLLLCGTFIVLGFLAHAIAFGLAICLLQLHLYLAAKPLRVALLLSGATVVSLLALRFVLVKSGIGAADFFPFRSLGLAAFGGAGTFAAIMPIFLFASLISFLAIRRRATPGVFVSLIALAAAFLIPEEISLPHLPRPMSFNGVRISTLTWIFLLMAAEECNPPRWLLAPSLAILLASLSLFHMDQTRLTQIHDGIRDAVHTLPPNSRVLLQTRRSGASVDGILHMIDSACIGHCYSLANYVPASNHFRIQRRDGCRLCLSAQRLVDFENSRFVVGEEDLPAWSVYATGPSQFAVAPLRFGELLQAQLIAP